MDLFHTESKALKDALATLGQDFVEFFFVQRKRMSPSSVTLLLEIPNQNLCLLLIKNFLRQQLDGHVYVIMVGTKVFREVKFQDDCW